MIALVIAVIGIVGFLSKKSINPVTGEKQYVNLTARRRSRWGLQAAPEMASQMGGVDRPEVRPTGQDSVAEVGHHIVETSDAGNPESPYREAFNFYLLNDADTINAFALPGGQVFITPRLFDKLQNEAQLAGCLGHEIGHVIGRHASEHMAKGQLGSMLATAVGCGKRRPQRQPRHGRRRSRPSGQPDAPVEIRAATTSPRATSSGSCS
jgi:predicted Zn-dependent protease